MKTPPFGIRALDHVVLRVRAIPPMLAFYCDVLGCRLEKQQDAIGLWQLRAGSALIDLLDCGDKALAAVGDGAAPAANRPANMDHFCLAIDRWDEAVLRAWLRQQGARIGESGTRYGAEGDGPSLYVFDPEGNQVELKGPPTAPVAQGREHPPGFWSDFP